MADTIGATYHKADWRMVEYQESAGNGPVRKIGFELTVGPQNHPARLRYFPEIWPKTDRGFYPTQQAQLYLTGGKESLFNNGVVLKRCDLNADNIIFESRRPKKSDPKSIRQINLSLSSGEARVTRFGDKTNEEKTNPQLNFLDSTPEVE